MLITIRINLEGRERTISQDMIGTFLHVHNIIHLASVSL